MFVRLSYHNIDDLFILSDAGVIDLNTKRQVSLSQIGDYDDFGWLELTSKNLEVICEYCAELGIESNGLKRIRFVRSAVPTNRITSNDVLN